MGVQVKISLDLTGDEVTLRDLRSFLAQAAKVGAAEDQDLREYDDNPAVIALQAIGTLDVDEPGR